MNDSDLNAKLRALRPPRRDTDYWEMFPRQVLNRAREAPAPLRRSVLLPRLAWSGSVAFASLVIVLCLASERDCPLKVLSHAMQNAKSSYQEVVQLPEHVRALMRIDRGMRYLIEDQP